MTNLDNIHDGIDNAESRAGDYVDRTPLSDDQKGSLRKASSAATSAAHDATDAAAAAIGSARDSVTGALDRVSEEYGKRPLLILAIGVGALVLVGVIAFATRNRG